MAKYFHHKLGFFRLFRKQWQHNRVFCLFDTSFLVLCNRVYSAKRYSGQETNLGPEVSHLLLEYSLTCSEYPMSSYISSPIQHCFPGRYYESRQNNREILFIKKTLKTISCLTDEGNRLKRVQFLQGVPVWRMRIIMCQSYFICK